MQLTNPIAVGRVAADGSLVRSIGIASVAHVGGSGDYTLTLTDTYESENFVVVVTLGDAPNFASIASTSGPTNEIDISIRTPALVAVDSLFWITVYQFTR